MEYNMGDYHRQENKITSSFHNSLPYPKADDIIAEHSYDYIIVGAGGNGCIVANKLATGDPDATVLLLEAGERPSPANTQIWDPKEWVKLQSDPTLEWGYVSTCQEAMYGRNIQLARCAALGGSTVHHSFLWVRGGRKSLDDWHKIYGCDGWGWDELVPYFEQLEKELPGQMGDKGKHSSWELALEQASIENGFGPKKDDYNVEDQDGTSYARYVPIDDEGKRVTLYQFYVEEPQSRGELQNLTVISGKVVNRLLLEANTKEQHQVYGLQYYPRYNPMHSNIMTVKAKREVILTAGGIATPIILNLSGIGDTKELESVGINPLVSMPGVGKNLVDDVFVMNDYKTSKDLPDGFMSYGIGGVLSFNGKYQVSTHSTEMPGLFNIPDEWKPGFLIGMDVHEIKSRGYVRLAKDDLYGLPVINVNFLKEEEDLDACVDALRMLRKIAHSNKLSEWSPVEVMPRPEVKNDNTEALKCYLRATCNTTFHYSGTCRMGIDGIGSLSTPPVVDPKNLKVYGFENLRIMDASIFPQNPCGNPQATSYSIALRGSDMVLQDNKFLFNNCH